MGSDGIVLEVVRGADRDFPLVITTDGATPSTAFLGTDTLTARVWAGEDQATLCTPAAVWLDAPSARYQVTVSAAQSGALDPGRYSLQVLAARSGRSAVVMDGALEVLAAPGTAAAPAVYGSFQDMRVLASWLDQVEQAGRFEAGFLAQRALARQRLDNAIATAFRGTSVGLFGSQSLAAFSWAGGGPRRSQLPSKLVLDYLAAGALMLRPKVTRLVACWAIGEVGLAHVGINNVFAAMGQYFTDLGDREALSLTAELDINADGIAEIPIHLGSSNTLFT